MKIFKTIEGKRVDVVEHTLEMLNKNPNIEIHIGTDSQSNRRFTTYVTVIAFRNGIRGVHYIYFKDKVKAIKDTWTRLWKEAELSLETAQWLQQQVSINLEIDMDYNPDEYYESNKLVAATKGYANSLGYKVNIKPDNQIATKAADHHCR